MTSTKGSKEMTFCRIDGEDGLAWTSPPTDVYYR